MSPEQARGEQVTTASDLYSYGIVLQELFTGKGAYLPGLSPEEQLAKAKEGETVAVTDLDPALTALINRLKSPAAAVRPTAVDVVEWLDRIEAAPYKRRRRILVWAAATLLAVVAVGMSYQTWRIHRQAQRIAEEAARANREAASAKEVSEFMVKVFEVSDPGQGRGETVTARELLDHAAKDIGGRLTDQPLVKARLELTLAHAYESLGLYQPALSLAENSLALRRAQLGPADPVLAESLFQLGEIHFLRSELDQSAPLLQSAADILEKSLGPESPALAQTLSTLADVYQNQGKIADAEQLHTRALKIYDKVLPGGDANVAVTLGDLAYLEYKQAKYAEAEPLFRRAIATYEKTVSPDDPRLAIALSQLGGLYRDQGNAELAEPLFLRSIAIQEKVLGPNHPFLALRLDGLARIYTDERKYAPAEALLLRAVSIQEKALGPNHAWLAQSLYNLALIYRDQGKIAQAEAFGRRTVSIYESARGPESLDVAAGLVLLAELDLQKSKPDQASPLLARALKIYDKAPAMDAYPRSLDAKALDLAGHSAEARVTAEALLGRGFRRKDFLQLCKKLGIKTSVTGSHETRP
jgi:tetratricopeptide (TPR) repeat protein